MGHSQRVLGLSGLGYILIALLFLVSLTHYNLVYGQKSIVVSDFLDSPAAYAQQKKGIMGPYGGTAEDGFYIEYNHRPVHIRYANPYKPPRFGEVLAYGTLQADGSLLAEGVHNYDYNYLIYGLSFIAGIGVLILFFKEWKFVRGRFEHA